MSHFIVPVKYYVGTLVALCLLTIITVWVSTLELGAWDIAIALIVAVIKATLVVLYFMGLRWDKGFISILFGGCLICLMIFIGFTYIDFAYRDLRDPLEVTGPAIKTAEDLAKDNKKADHH